MFEITKKRIGTKVFWVKDEVTSTTKTASVSLKSHVPRIKLFNP